MAEIDRAGDALKALRAIRKRVDGAMKQRHIADFPRFVELVGDGDFQRATMRIRETLRRFGGDPEISAAQAMLGASEHCQGGVEDRLKSFAKAEFISYDTARRRGDRGLRKLAVILTSEDHDPDSLPMVQVWVGRDGDAVAIQLAVDYRADEFRSPSPPRVEFRDDMCPIGIPWADGPTHENSSGLWKKKISGWRWPDDTHPQEIIFGFVEMVEFRSVLTVDPYLGKAVSMFRVADLLIVRFHEQARPNEAATNFYEFEPMDSPS